MNEDAYDVISGGTYRDMWVFAESRDGEFLPVALEMLGKARELMDAYNEEYDADEKVVAVVVGPDAPLLGQEAIEHGADIAYVAEHPELEVFRLWPYTRVVAEAALMNDDYKDYDKPRYFLFPATNNGRDLSATVAGRLDTGLASDCDELYIEDVEIKHRFKTGGDPQVFERILHMVRPDFSGFEHSTILCLDNPDRDFHPQACSVIPGSFQAQATDTSRTGKILNIPVNLQEMDTQVVVKNRRKLDDGVDLTQFPVVVAIGRGINDDPTQGLKLGTQLSKVLDTELGLSRGIITANYEVDGAVQQYVDEQRQIGETGQVVQPEVYIAAGISGAVQHQAGMRTSKVIVAINKDADAPIFKLAHYG
ncbi:MAG: electron transfer flavoprotein subunit alpha/FixB family protein, partial [Candidatus Thermoplasmatota archaeon]|nr:electron transfer flavoprotein subunit alpha/FixB family protein [Candidatus Thermoplasmatota archaeon]